MPRQQKIGSGGGVLQSVAAKFGNALKNEAEERANRALSELTRGGGKRRGVSAKNVSTVAFPSVKPVKSLKSVKPVKPVKPVKVRSVPITAKSVDGSKTKPSAPGDGSKRVPVTLRAAPKKRTSKVQPAPLWSLPTF